MEDDYLQQVDRTVCLHKTFHSGRQRMHHIVAFGSVRRQDGAVDTRNNPLISLCIEVGCVNISKDIVLACLVCCYRILVICCNSHAARLLDPIGFFSTFS